MLRVEGSKESRARKATSFRRVAALFVVVVAVPGGLELVAVMEMVDGDVAAGAATTEDNGMTEYFDKNVESNGDTDEDGGRKE